MVGGEVYVQGLTTNPAKPWTRGSTDIASLLPAADPRTLLKELATAATLHPTGTKTINGIHAGGYRETLDPHEVVKRVPDLKESLNDVIAGGGTGSDVQVWVDDQKRVVRITTAIKGATPGNQSAPTASEQTVDFSDWGAPVTITASPASQVQ